MMTTRSLIASLAMVSLSGCAGVRFANRHILWTVHDDAAIQPPAPREVLLLGPGVRDELFRSADQVLSLDYGREAQNVNALDEVPDSSWFEDPRRDHAFEDGRLHPLSDEEMFRGATFGDEPPVPPYTVQKAKTEGATPGFIVTDARGRKYALKLDPPGWPRMATGTEIVSTRLVWSLGWRVPKMWLIDLRPSQLILGKKATTKNEFFQTVPLDETRFRELLNRLPIAGDEPIPALLSLWIPGKVIGAYSYIGRRKDDPNDVIPHELRRDLRGYRIVCAWINNIDTQELNTLDSYIDGHIVHYQQDVGGSFGNRGTGPTEYYQGHERYFESSRILFSLITFGVIPRPWEGVLDARAHMLARWPELGYFDGEHFDPKTWEPMIYNPAFGRATARDDYWGAKRVAAVSARELRAAIASGGYRPELAERLFQVLWERRRKIVRTYLGGATALDHFRVENRHLCFDDLAGELGPPQIHVDNGRLDGACVAPRSLRGYQIIRLKTRRRGQRTFASAVKVHLIDGHVVGVER